MLVSPSGRAVAAAVKRAVAVAVAASAEAAAVAVTEVQCAYVEAFVVEPEAAAAVFAARLQLDRAVVAC